jgi:hypothetical protein
MKKIILLAIAVAGFTLWSADSTAQLVVVQVKPTAPVVVRVAAPSPKHVWITDEWVLRNGKYVHQPGYWMVPGNGKSWKNGYWKNGKGGHYWVPGRWNNSKQYNNSHKGKSHHKKGKKN